MNVRTVRNRAAWCSLALASALVAPACSALPGGGSAPSAQSAPPAQTAPSTAPASSAASASAPGTPAATPSDAPTPTGPATGAAPQSLASKQFTGTAPYAGQARIRVRFDILELKRRGDLLDLTATLTNLETDQSRDLRWQVASRFNGPYRKDITSTDGAFSGAVLTDVAGKKRYLVAADSGNECVCTVQLSSTFVGAGQSVDLSATYAAPPVTTTKLDVSVTSLGTFRDLPVS